MLASQYFSNISAKAGPFLSLFRDSGSKYIHYKLILSKNIPLLGSMSADLNQKFP
jgi:hypothetical protein